MPEPYKSSYKRQADAKRQTMKTLLVIGAGYIGAELVRQARLSGWKVYPVTKSGENGSIKADVTSQDCLKCLKENASKIDVIIHCASSGRGGVEAYQAVFYNGVKNLSEVFEDVPLIFVSSTSVYTQTAGEVVTEESETNPIRETGEILLSAENIVMKKCGVVARLAGIYGPKRSVLLKKLLNQTAMIEEDGKRLINQIHRDDAASALFFLANKLIDKEISGERYNVSDSHPRSQLETYEGLCGILNLPLPPRGERDLNRKRGWTHKAVSNEKLISLGWKPQYPDFLESAESISNTLFL